ncbi:MAG: glycoside hydrolase family 3 C-terminal domain-containing protein, partial [Clostridia bacterium]|nr:glycoside hydrolase family 3 C-terminal domain-containing protein [Clostridia bacterium]
DLPRTMFYDGSSYKKWDAKNKQPVPGARNADDHYLQLDANETAMIKEACDNFDKVVVAVNSASPIELGFLDDPTHYAYNEKIKAALWLGHPGSSGLNALGRVLKGEVDPSGRTVDTFARDFKLDPSWQNFGNYLENDGNRYYTGSKARGAYFVEYREGIYVGYRWYETMAEELDAKDGSGEAWYGENVVYPFGYGLSYT